MKLLIQAVDYFFIGFPCFYCCFLIVWKDTPHTSNVQRLRPWAGLCALLFSALSTLSSLTLPRFFACTIALALSGFAARRCVGKTVSFHNLLSALFFVFLIITLLELVIGLTAAAALRFVPLHGGFDWIRPCLSLGLSVLLAFALCRLFQAKALPFPSEHISALAVLCCALYAVSLMSAGQNGTSIPLHGFLLPLLLLSLLLCAVGLRDSRQKRLLKRELRHKTDELNRKTAEMKQLHTEIHTYRGLVQSNKNKVDEMAALVSRFHSASGIFQTEFAEEFDSLRQNTQEIYQLTAKHAEASFLVGQTLGKTGFPQLDLLLENCLKLCIENGVIFQLSVITPFEERYRPMELEGLHLAGMIAEHVLDALRAVRRAGVDGGEILMTMGFVGGEQAGSHWAGGARRNSFYSVDIFDNGEAFSLDILGRLGSGDGVTTGGSGIGFPTTLERLALCNGSLIVQDLDPQKNGGMSACVSLQFDGERRFEIRSDLRQAEIDLLRAKNPNADLLLLSR